MIGNLKALGLLLMAALAMNAMAASSASAQGELTSKPLEGVTLTATQTGAYGSGANALTMFGGKAECEKATYTGHKFNETPHQLIPSGAGAVTITPHYGLCTGLGGLPTTVDMNGCDYEFHILGTSEGVADTYRLTPTVECPAGKHIVVTLWKSGVAHTGPAECTLTITEKTDYSNNTLVAKDTTNGKVDITGTINEIEIHKEGSLIICNKTTTKEGILHLDLTVEGRNAFGEATGISISD